MYLNQKIHVVLSGIVTVSLLVSCNPGTDSSKKRSQLQGADAQSTGSQTPTDTDAKQPNSVAVHSVNRYLSFFFWNKLFLWLIGFSLMV